MTTATVGINISPVNMEERQNLGIKAGDTVRVHQKIQDKGKTRIQVFEGLVLARKHGTEPGATFTVRKVASGIGVEKVFPLYSPNIDKIEIVRRSKVRAKLYYIREKVAREIKRQMRRMQMMSLSTESETEMAQQAEKDAAEKAEAEAKAAEEKAAKEAEEQAAAEAKTTEATEVAETATEAETPKEEASEPEEKKD